MEYDRIGRNYDRYRVADPRIAASIHRGLGRASTVVNVGAGVGSYEPTDRRVVAVEPSATMIAQRRTPDVEVVQASAEGLPFPDAAFDAAMAILTVHHWADWRKGLDEMRRVASRIVVLTWDSSSDGFWLTQDYFPELIALDRALFPAIEDLRGALGRARVEPVPIPSDCTDGFLGAYWSRPHAYLDAGVRGAISSFSRLNDVDSGLRRLAADLESGRWHRRHGQLTERDSLDLGYRLVVSGDEPSSPRVPPSSPPG
ncbi:MerR family transcriptional regulator [Sorangium cellulosum]|uniref:MerR family transcriptional regulator n=1 Tax=Sorangium cellulosum TaxID=56 RepID=A0A2L0EYM1_SORCE|nr:class I SAM-dependent methyltransferase [Sorangium cellulosum]AUX44380.1 MerR family transcriptional regulator [Sorangium cellulosum]